MSIKRKRHNRVVESDTPVTTISTTVNWTVVIAVVVGVVLLVPTIGFTLRLLDALTETQLIVSGAIVGTIVLVIVITLCWTIVVVAYSKLRSKEDQMDDLSELRLLRAIQQGAVPSVAPTYQMLPGGMDQEALTQLLQQRQQITPPTVIDFEQPVEYN